MITAWEPRVMEKTKSTKNFETESTFRYLNLGQAVFGGRSNYAAILFESVLVKFRSDSDLHASLLG